MKNHKNRFANLHNNPPAPFNPDCDPKAKKRYALVTDSMEKDNYYDSHTREECAIEWRKRYEKFKEDGM
jgi:hypothetical protein